MLGQGHVRARGDLAGAGQQRGGVLDPARPLHQTLGEVTGDRGQAEPAPEKPWLEIVKGDHSPRELVEMLDREMRAAALHLAAQDPDAILLVAPSDHVVPDAQAFRAAVAAVEDDLRQLQRRLSGEIPAEDHALFDALLLMLGSDSIVGETVTRIRAGNWAPGALRETIAEHVRVFETMDDPYLRERASDIRDLGRRVLTRLQSDHPTSRPAYSRTVLVGDDISPTQLAEVPIEQLAGIVSASGSSSSHVAILAQAMGIPAVLGVEDMTVGRLEGQTLIADGYRGDVFVNPSVIVRDEFVRLQTEESELTEGLKKVAGKPSVTPDNVTVPLYINTGLVSGNEPAVHSEGDGVGLYRTEIPFLMREQFPGEDEQTRIYRKAMESFVPRPVTLRTLDVGGDKMLTYFPVQEDNPFLGWRGIRISLDHPEIFLTQLRAMLRASVGLDNLTILLPMISTVTELDLSMTFISQAIGELLDDGLEVQRPPVGIMIELPSAAMVASSRRSGSSPQSWSSIARTDSSNPASVACCFIWPYIRSTLGASTQPLRSRLSECR